MIRIDVMLRSHQINYLKRVARLEGISVSNALRDVLKNQPVVADFSPKLPLSHRVKVLVDEDTFEVMEQMKRRFGVDRSDIARRLIDALVSDQSR